MLCQLQLVAEAPFPPFPPFHVEKYPGITMRTPIGMFSPISQALPRGITRARALQVALLQGHADTPKARG